MDAVEEGLKSAESLGGFVITCHDRAERWALDSEFGYGLSFCMEAQPRTNNGAGEKDADGSVIALATLRLA